MNTRLSPSTSSRTTHRQACEQLLGIKSPVKKRRRAVAAPVEATQPLRNQLLQFIEYHRPARLSRNLRRMMMEFLMTDNGIETPYLKGLLYDLEGLFEVLEGG